MRQVIERIVIAGRSIEIVRTKGQDMARPGRKLKQGARQPDGRLRPPTMKMLNDANARETMEMTAVARMQPHRRGSDDKLLTSALGRFCRKMGCKDSVYDGVEAYAKYKQRWSVAIGARKAMSTTSGGGSGEGPSEEQIRTWLRKVIEIETMVGVKFGTAIFSLVHKLAIEDVDVPSANDERIRSALGEIAVLTGCLDKNPHPFR